MTARWDYQNGDVFDIDMGGEDFTFGMELVLDLKDVHRERMRNELVIAEFATQLVELIDMKAFGAPAIHHFGHDNPDTAGYTLVQLIETSSIVAHFSEGLNSIHINVFSCKWFHARGAMAWICEFWEAGQARGKVLYR